MVDRILSPFEAYMCSFAGCTNKALYLSDEYGFICIDHKKLDRIVNQGFNINSTATRARHDYDCSYCGATILKGQVYYRFDLLRCYLTCCTLDHMAIMLLAQGVKVLYP